MYLVFSVVFWDILGIKNQWERWQRDEWERTKKSNAALLGENTVKMYRADRNNQQRICLEGEMQTMISNKRIRAAKYGYIILSVLLCVLGMVLILVPNFSASMLCWIGGLLLAVFGLVKIIGYCSKDLYRLAFQFDLAFGILLLALGLILILRTQAVVNVIWVLVGIFILSDALLKIQISIDARLFGIHQWWMILTAAIITGTIGFLLVLHPSESKQVVMILLGISLCCEGILNLVTILTAVKIIRKQHPNRLEADFVQKNEEIL